MKLSPTIVRQAVRFEPVPVIACLDPANVYEVEDKILKFLETAGIECCCTDDYKAAKQPFLSDGKTSFSL